MTSTAAPPRRVAVVTDGGVVTALTLRGDFETPDAR
jgi:hypothetical protein